MDWNELPMMGNSDDDDDDEDPNNDPFTIKVNDLWSMKTAEKLDDLLESITNTLLYREHKWVPPGTTRKPSTQKTDFDKLFETSMKMIDSPNENRFKYQFSARRILMLIVKYLDCDQTKLVYNTCIRQLQIDPCDKQYSKELVGFSACCLSRLNFEHVLTKEQAGDLMKELIPLASRIFIAELSHLDPKKRFALIRKDGYLFPIDYIGSDQVDHLYPILIGFLFALARYSGFDEYYEYAKSVFYDAESKRVVGGDVMVVLNIMLIINERIMLGYDADPCSRRRFSYAFLEELSEFTMRLISISRDFIRGPLVFIIKNRLRSAISYCNPMKHGEIADTLVDHFISRHDDPTADYFIITVFEEMFGLMILPIVFEGKEEAIREKFDRLNLSPEWREPFRVLLYPPDEVL